MNLNYNKVKLYTLGCKVNQYETEAISEIFEEAGYEIVDEEFADIYVINTCTVTSLSDSKSRQIIRKFKRTNPDSTVVVMGCYSQVADKDVEKIESVDVIIGTTERNEIVNLVEEFQTTGQRINIVRDITGDRTFQPIDITNLRDMTRAYLKVQDG
ncbi:MAG: tRNA (N(6)-L-threonylcarbamoyladenosine(37)-C(2))-methylthiotransferase MtaB, partial [Tissierellia bacterium]|nr:tRNA (N(6)-L-threonylcarbamoyladenosine(37)-C(2))-methylthiotransferase MtaB [Tissierellia bacterium]